MTNLKYTAIGLLLFNLSVPALGAGTQFITGPCNSDSDCASACCGFNTGLCAGPVVAQQRDGGCGHGNASPNANAAIALGFNPTGAVAASTVVNSGAATSPVAVAAAAAVAAVSPPTGARAAAGANPSLIGNAAAKQFITGACASDADCASGCCGFKTGLCAGAVVAQQRDGGCGFGNATPNDNAAVALGFTGPAPTAAAVKAAVAVTSATPAAPTAAPATPPTGARAAAAANPSLIGNAAAKQFITGACASDADCASGCCGFKSGLCAGAIIAQTRDGGCGFGNAAPNNNAAVALRGGQKRRGFMERRDVQG